MKAITEYFKKKLQAIATRAVKFGKAFVAFWIGVGQFFKKLPERLGNFFTNLPANTKKFFTTMTKEKAIDLLIGTGAVVVWSSPVFILLYVLFWFMSRS